LSRTLPRAISGSDAIEVSNRAASSATVVILSEAKDPRGSKNEIPRLRSG
jgi:hypothetical protein